jgi:hypothetical protein
MVASFGMVWGIGGHEALLWGLGEWGGLAMGAGLGWRMGVPVEACGALLGSFAADTVVVGLGLGAGGAVAVDPGSLARARWIRRE